MSYEDCCQREYAMYLDEIGDRVRSICNQSKGDCEKIGISSIGFGPDGPLGHIFLSVCSEECAVNARKILNEQWIHISHDADKSEHIPEVSQEQKVDSELVFV